MNLNAIIAILIVVAIILVAVVMMLAIARAQEKSFCKLFMIRLANQGNARSHYELWADDPAHVLRFDFSLNGIMLGQMGGGSQTAGQTPPSAPTAAPNVAVAKAQEAAGAASGFAEVIGGVLDTLGHLLPGSAGSSLLSLGMRLRQGENSVQRVSRVGQRAEGLGRRAGDFAASAKGAAASRNGNSAHVEQPNAEVDDADATTGYPQTPYVEPGDQIEVALAVRPALRLKEDRVPFSVNSVCLEEENAQPVSQSSVIVFAGMTGIRYYLPYLVVGGAALLLIVFLLVSTNVFG
jgi:flagellar basal body-associated protein FliL